MIAIVYPQFYGVGGIARYLDSFLSNLPPGHPPIYVITGDEGRQSRHYPGVEIIHIPFESSRYSLISWSLKARRLLLRLHQEGRISAVNLHTPPLIPGLMLPRSLPLVLTAHGTYLGLSGQFDEVRYFKSQWNPLSVAVKRLMERVIFRHSARVISLTTRGQKEVRAYGYQGPIAIVPNGVDIKRFVPDPAVPKDIDVLFVGRIEIGKGSRPMVECCKRLIAGNPHVRIAIVGYGEDEAFVRRELDPFSKNVLLTGKLPFEQVRDYYARSKVYVSCSYYEGLPGTCLEAMAMGLPAVVWDLFFYEGLVAHGRTGYVSPPDDLTNMVSAIGRLLANPDGMTTFGRAGREHLLSNYDWKALSIAVLNWIGHEGQRIPS